MNYTATSGQRWANQEEFYEIRARQGNPLTFSEFISRLKKVRGFSSLCFLPGRIEGDVAVSKLTPQGLQYLFYIPTDYKLPEFSIMEFADYDVPVREKQRGWRTVLLRLIQASIISEQDAHAEFGTPSGIGATRYLRELYNHRNRKLDG